MRLARNLRLSSKALFTHRVRSILAIAGTSLGVAALLVLLAVGEGASREIRRQVENLGGNLLVVRAGRATPLPGRGGAAGLVDTLTPEDAIALAELPLVALTAASRDANMEIKHGILTTRTSVRATSAEYETIRNFATVRGRYFAPEEDAASARVTVIGSRVAGTLFEGVDPLGKQIRVGRVPFEVIGVLESKGSSTNAGSDEDNQMLIPLRTGLRRVFNVDDVTLVYAQVTDQASMDAASEQIAATLRARHRLLELERPDDFQIDNQLLVVEAERQAAASFRRLAVTLATASLLVGGVGILSIMMLSVRERRGEVGLRLAVGARRRDIQTQFVVEALVLGATGGLLGIAGGLLGAEAVSRSTEWAAVVSAQALGLSAGAAVAIAVLFGAAPARRAASLDPIQSLHAD